MVARVRGPKMWKGRTFTAVEFEHPRLPEVQYWTSTGDIAARTFPGGTLENDPPPVRIHWPLSVGRIGWNRWKLRLPNGKVTDVEECVVVGKYGGVETFAGTFEAFEIARFSGKTRRIEWWSPKLRIMVKAREEQTGGTHVRELVKFNPAQ